MATEITSGAATRIHRFSSVVWVVGVLLVGLVAVVTIYLRFTEDDRWFQQFPWYQNEPTLATLEEDGVTWSAAGNALVPVPDELLAAGPLLLEFTGDAGSGWISPAYTPPGPSPTAETRVLESIDYHSPQNVVFAEPGGKLWVHAEQAWRLRITHLDYEEIDSGVEGNGPVFLRYRGSAGAATITMDDIFADLLIVSVDDRDHVYFEKEKTHFSWEPGTDIVLYLKANPGTRWSLVFHEVTGVSEDEVVS